MAVEAMREGAFDFMRKPILEQGLLDRIHEALEHEAGTRRNIFDREQMLKRLSTLTTREVEVFESVAEGNANKVIGMDLGISERTVEVHRSQVMRKLQVASLAQLVKIKINLAKPVE
jgi:FixJ family two-component response regulator